MRHIFKSICAVALATMVSSCSNAPKPKANYDVIPLPQEITMGSAAPFFLNNNTAISYPEGNAKLQRTANFLASYIEKATDKKLVVTTEASNSNVIILSLDKSIEQPEGYKLTTSKQNITINGSTEAGVFYGVQTLRKAIPAMSNGMDIELPSVEVVDFPRFKYRGVHLDVGRHTFPVDSIKQFIDVLALSNINTFHWHLTEDQGWRIEIKKYPRLAEISSKRKETVIGRNSGEYDGKPYQGYFTQDEIREVVAYASERFITIVPEIDLPGHMQAALAAYPAFGCTGGPYEVVTSFGVFDEVLCAGNEKALNFVEDVLSEVIELFPSKYIHIGGDECPKTRWEKCPKCQSRIKAEGLKSDAEHSAEHRLQSYVITRMEKFVNSKGRQIIGWDEILEGGLAPNATLMAWRGVEYGAQAAKLKHDVIMTPGSHLYFDHYQSLDKEEPLAIGGYSNIERVYSYEPIPAGLTPEEEKFIIGTQANLWTEYMPTYAQVEYMLIPRVAALSEVQWTMPEKKNYDAFLPRLLRMINLYEQEGFNYAKHVFDVKAVYTPNPATGSLDVALSTLGTDGTIHYTLDGNDPTAASQVYMQPIEIGKACMLKAIVVRPAGNSRILNEKVVLNKASLKPITLNKAADKGYAFNGADALIDGLNGNDNYKTGRWIGFRANDLDVTIDFKAATEFSKVAFANLVVKGDWVMGATNIAVSVSEDGKTFREIATKKIAEQGKKDKDGIFNHEITFAPIKARYLQVVIKTGDLPAWHGGAGKPAYMFVDEIRVD